MQSMFTRSRRARLAVACAGVLLASAAHAAGWSAQAALTAKQVVQPTNSTAIGSLSLIYGGQDTVTFSLVFQGLTANASDVTINQGKVGANGAVILDLGTLGMGPQKEKVGTLNVFLPVTPAQAALLISGGAYVLIDTTAFPNGEIRGQIVNTVPEPAPMVALAAGVIGLLVRRRRKIGPSKAKA